MIREKEGTQSTGAFLPPFLPSSFVSNLSPTPPQQLGNDELSRRTRRWGHNSQARDVNILHRNSGHQLGCTVVAGLQHQPNGRGNYQNALQNIITERMPHSVCTLSQILVRDVSWLCALPKEFNITRRSADDRNWVGSPRKSCGLLVRLVSK